MITGLELFPHQDLELWPLVDLDADTPKIRWRTPGIGDHFVTADNWFEIQEILFRLGKPGWEYLVIVPVKQTGTRRWAQSLGRPHALTVEVAEAVGTSMDPDLWRLGRDGPRHPWINIHAQPSSELWVRPCQILTADEAIVAFHDWLVYGQVDGFTREPVEY